MQIVEPTKRAHWSGRSAFVGLAVMVALWPVPGYAITYMQKIQKDRMKLVRLLAASVHKNIQLTCPVDGRTRSRNLRMYALSV